MTMVTEVNTVLVVQPEEGGGGLIDRDVQEGVLEEVLGSTVDTLPATGSPSIEDTEAMIIKTYT